MIQKSIRRRFLLLRLYLRWRMRSCASILLCTLHPPFLYMISHYKASCAAFQHKATPPTENSPANLLAGLFLGLFLRPRGQIG